MGFAKAIKRDAKGRVAFVGPSGSGKSYTMLMLARTLAGPTGKIAAIDTEHGSLSKYADLFEFDCDEPSITSVDYFLKQLDAAERGGYAVFCCDSLSHFWIGPGGALEFVDEKNKASGNRDTFSGWKAFRPHERAMVDRMIASPCHIIVTMRTQTEYVEEINERGKKVRRKIGLKPIQRDGLEYEFDLVGSMDEDNTLVVDKTRVMLANGTAPYTGKAFAKPTAKDFAPFIEWLKGTKTDTANRSTEQPPSEFITPPQYAELRAEAHDHGCVLSQILSAYGVERGSQLKGDDLSKIRERIRNRDAAFMPATQPAREDQKAIPHTTALAA
jgi:energy-coupling factor transporter ATP-binding protein EcfA2